jgi:hypothetical protein
MRSPTLPAVVVAVSCTLLVVVRVATAPAPKTARAATVAERADVAQAVANNEREWSMDTSKNFPADVWSQSDDFHGREYKRVLELAQEKGIRIEDVLGAVDDDIHRPHRRSNFIIGGGMFDRHAHAVPCKPRPFYD